MKPFNFIYVIAIFFISKSLFFAQQIPCTINDTSATCFLKIHFDSIKIGLEKKITFSNIDVKVQSLIVADINNDCIPEIMGIGSQSSGNYVYIFNSLSGILIQKIQIPSIPFIANSFSIADVDNDNIVEFFLVTSRQDIDRTLHNKLICINMDGTTRWVSNNTINENNRNWNSSSIGFADFNMDGNPEVYIGNKIYNALTGVLLLNGGNNGIGLGYQSTVSIAGNLDDDKSDLELAAGYTIYKVSIKNQNGQLGNKISPFNIPVNNKLRDGNTAIADINGDGILDVIVSSEIGVNKSDATLYAYSLLNNIVTLLSSVSLPNINPRIKPYQIGFPSIGKIDYSGNVAIIISRRNKLLAYKYDNSLKFNLDWIINTSDRSGFTGSTLFDIDGNGICELIYRDESKIRLFSAIKNPPTEIINSICMSPTLQESPIVADIYNDGHSYICITCTDSSLTEKITIFGSPDSLPPWAPARRVWNQYAYNVLNINDDLTVPQYQKNNATYENSRYNNFMQQQSLLDSNGNYKVRAASLDGIIHCINYDPVTDMYTAVFDIYNRSSASLTIPSGLPVSFFNGDPQNGGTLIGVYYTTMEIGPGGSMTMLRYRFAATNLTELHMVVNSDKTSFNPIDEEDFLNLECDYLDNFSQITDIPQVEMKADSICDGDSYDFGDTTLLTSGIYYRVLKKISGCDSLYVSLELDVIDTLLFVSKQEACDSFFWEGEVYKESGMYSHVNANLQGGCDTTIVLDLIVYHATKSTIAQTACDTYTWKGNVYTQSGMHSHVIANLQGCDSTITLDLTINPSRESSITKTVCDSYIWHGTTYDQSGKYQFDTMTQLGCDSVVILDLFIRDTIKITDVINICAGDSVLVFEEYVKEEKIQSKAFVTSTGCDSIQTIEVLVDPLLKSQINQRICEGDSVFVVDRWIKEEGMYSQVHVSQQGCDTIITTVIILLQNSISYDTMSICEGDSVFIFEEWKKDSGDYSQVIANLQGCDSTANVHVAAIPPSSSSQTVVLCPGDSVFIDGNWRKETGAYSQVIANLRGCDSIITTVVTTIDPPEGPTAELDCETLEITASVELQNPWSARWNNGDTTAHTTYTDQSTATLTLFAQPNCQQQFTIDLPSIPRLGGAGYSKDTVLAPGGSLIIDLGLDPKEWSVLWSPSELVDCDTCMRVIISPTEDVQITIYYRHISGCIFESSFFIRLVNEGIYFPNVFTPNSDGINDGWIPFHTPNITLLKLEVYDRWGELVYKSTRTDKGKLSVFPWDGQFRDRPMSPAVFTYLVEYRNSKGEMVVKAGDVTLVR